jgi:hypothetical protein
METEMAGNVLALAAIVGLSALATGAEAHTLDGTHLMFINNVPKAAPYYVTHKDADCPNPPYWLKKASAN